MAVAAGCLLAGVAARAATPAESPEALLADADSHYARRHEGRNGTVASPAEIAQAVEGYARAAQDPGNAEARWKLARAFYFQGTYTGLDEPARRALYARGRGAGEEALEIVLRRHGFSGSVRSLEPAAAAALVRGDPDAAPALFWTAVDWGQWGLASPKLEAARKGAASRVRDDCLALIALDPAFEEGGGYRVLGRLHDQAPRIPLLTGWVSRSEGVRYLRLAVAAAPHNVVNLHFLAEALSRNADRSEAIAVEERALAETPDPGHLVEELAIQETARKNLESWRAGPVR